MEIRPVIIADKLCKFTEHWSPKIIAQMNDYHLKLVKFQGDFVWHQHSYTDEVFLVLDGEMTINFSGWRRPGEKGRAVRHSEGQRTQDVGHVRMPRDAH